MFYSDNLKKIVIFSIVFFQEKMESQLIFIKASTVELEVEMTKKMLIKI